METLTSITSVQFDEKDKEKATNILKDLGVNLSTVGDSLPFEISNPKPGKELLEALQEGEQIIKDIECGKRKGYNNVNEIMRAIIDN